MLDTDSTVLGMSNWTEWNMLNDAQQFPKKFLQHRVEQDLTVIQHKG